MNQQPAIANRFDPATPDPISREPETIPFDRAEFDHSIVRRFENVVAKLPEHVAVIGDDRNWTYAELDRRVNQIANVILQMTSPGIGCVSYLVEHSPDMVICALAALKAGKAFLCLHPGLPDAGKQEVISDAKPGLLLCSIRYQESARAAANGICDIVLLDEIGHDLLAERPEISIDSRDPAAIFYTSGSTGRPKGIVKSHRVVLHRAWLCAQDDFIRQDDRQSLLTFCSFASSEADLFGALLNGATLALYDVRSRGLTDFEAWIDHHQITLLHPPVVLFRRYLASLRGAEHHPSVRLVALAGEAVAESDVLRWRERFTSNCELRHRFSSTEAGHVAVACIEAGSKADSQLAHAARPVADKFLSVIDEKGDEVSSGAGELVVRSAFLSDGYWRKPDETAADFVADSRDPNQRIFRTGDLGRLLPDGRFEFLGRRDNQVKIRGYRVETREVEDALLRVPHVREAAVVVERTADEARLTGFAVIDGDATFNADSIRAQLRSMLPPWKVPSELHSIDVLPLTLTGKIDRQRLLSVARATSVQSPSVDPTSSIATDSDPVLVGLLQMWEQVLGRKNISPSDNFFDLGGHSLLAVELMQQIKKQFGPSLPLTTLAEAPTARQLAVVVRGSRRSLTETRQPSAIVTLKSGISSRPLFCVPPANGSPFTYASLARLLNSDQPVVALQLEGREFKGAEMRTVPEMASGLIELARIVQPSRPYRLCGHSFGAVLAFEMAQQFAAAGDQVEFLALLDGRAPGTRRPLPLHRRWAKHLLQLCKTHPRNWRRYFNPHRTDPVLPAESGESIQSVREAAFRTYRPQRYAGPITLFRAEVKPDWMRFTAPQPANGWDTFCDRIEIQSVPGDHLSMLQAPNLVALADAMNRSLGRLPDGAPQG